MRKRVISKAICTVFSFLLITALSQISVTEAASEKAIQLTFSDMFPTANLHGVLNQQFCDEIKNRTGGRVDITLYPAGSLTSPAKCYQGVVKGISDICMSSAAYVPGRFPASEAFLKPLPTYSGWVTTKVINDFYDEFKPAEYDDVHVLYFHGPGPNIIATRNVAVTKLSDLKGLVMRAVGPTVDTLEAWGATPRGMPMGETYEALAKGIVEGTFTAAETLKGFKLADVVKYVTIPPISNVGIIFAVMNKEKWNSLPKDIKEVFNKVSQEWVERRCMVWRYYDKAGLDYFESLAKGREIITIPKDQEKEWKESAQSALVSYIKYTEAKGVPGADYLDYIEKRTIYWGERQQSEEYCTKWVNENLLKK